MNRENCDEIFTLLSNFLFKECNEVGKVNLCNIHNIINILVKANIPFVLDFVEGTRSRVKSITIRISISPTTSISKTFQLEEGRIL